MGVSALTAKSTSGAMTSFTWFQVVQDEKNF
jgi:hypothetical protein